MAKRYVRADGYGNLPGFSPRGVYRIESEGDDYAMRELRQEGFGVEVEGPDRLMENYEAKRDALIDLIREAHFEVEGGYPRAGLEKGVYKPFEAAGVQTYHVDSLVRALQTSDALEVLYRMIVPE
jgi:hypothetical protein